MELSWLPANQAFCFTWGEQIVPMGDAPRFIPTAAEAVEAARKCGLYVSSWGVVSRDPKTEGEYK